MMNILIIGAGGFFGAVARYLLNGQALKMMPQLPSYGGILIVNVVGCLLIGLLAGLAQAKGAFNPQLKLFLIVGFVGAFTTFSTLCHDAIVLMSAQRLLVAIVHVALSVVLGIGAVYVGYVIVGKTV